MDFINLKTKEDIETVLDYVEGWNKQDKDELTAQAAADLREWLSKLEVAKYSN